MSSRKKRFGELAHIARITVGLMKADGKRPVSRDEQERVIDAALFHAGKAATVSAGRGKWRHPKTGQVFDEPSLIIDVVSSGTKNSCDLFYRRMKNIASRAAAIADQHAVLVNATCANGKTQGDVVSKTGRPFPLRAVRRRRKRAR